MVNSQKYFLIFKKDQVDITQFCQMLPLSFLYLVSRD